MSSPAAPSLLYAVLQLLSTMISLEMMIRLRSVGAIDGDGEGNYGYDIAPSLREEEADNVRGSSQAHGDDDTGVGGAVTLDSSDGDLSESNDEEDSDKEEVEEDGEDEEENEDGGEEDNDNKPTEVDQVNEEGILEHGIRGLGHRAYIAAAAASLRGSPIQEDFFSCRGASRRRAPMSIPLVLDDEDQKQLPHPSTFERRLRRRLPERFPARDTAPTERQTHTRTTNPCLNTCMRFPLTEASCLKCDIHTFVYFIASCLYLCRIVWEVVPPEERAPCWEPSSDDDDEEGSSPEPRRMCGWNVWWMFVEDRTDGSLYAWKAVKRLWRLVKRVCRIGPS
ncbi:hypothetical protein ABEF91_004935 [Exophiala dermatitidis]